MKMYFIMEVYLKNKSLFKLHFLNHVHIMISHKYSQSNNDFCHDKYTMKFLKIKINI